MIYHVIVLVVVVVVSSKPRQAGHHLMQDAHIYQYQLIDQSINVCYVICLLCVSLQGYKHDQDFKIQKNFYESTA